MSTRSRCSKTSVATSSKESTKVSSKRIASKTKEKALHSEKSSNEVAAGEDDVSGDVEKCGICENKIIDGKEQAWLCEGACKQWVHRYCAGVSIALFKHLSTSTTSFHCYACSQLSHENELASLRESVSVLQGEVEVLREAVS